MKERAKYVITNANVYTPQGTKALKGEAMGRIAHFPSCQIEVVDGVITYVGPSRAVDSAYDRIDLAGRALLPGFVDSHTHLPFVGTREDEFMWRMRGDSYMSIMERGGGIVNTMKSVRAASADDLAAYMERDILPKMADQGFVVVEGKSGYGLDHDTEIRQLQAIKEYNERAHGVELVPTYLGAHALPPEYAGNPDKYIDFMIAEMLPEVKELGLAKFCDVFCEKGVFSVQQSRRLLQAAKSLGFDIKVHADEITWTGGAELAAELGAVSADHLLHVSDSGIAALAASDTIATLLPLTAFTLNEPYAPARKMIDAGCAVALATDFNPGSCFSYSAPLMIALACIHMHMSVEEAITALTLNGAAAVGMADAVGSIEVGKRAAFAPLSVDNINMLPYRTGENLVCKLQH